VRTEAAQPCALQRAVAAELQTARQIVVDGQTPKHRPDGRAVVACEELAPESLCTLYAAAGAVSPCFGVKTPLPLVLLAFTK
jgi:hypothetical protein